MDGVPRSPVSKAWFVLASPHSRQGATLTMAAVFLLAIVVAWKEPGYVAAIAVLALLIAAWALRITVEQLASMHEYESTRRQHEQNVERLLGSIDERLAKTEADAREADAKPAN